MGKGGLGPPRPPAGQNLEILGPENPYIDLKSLFGGSGGPPPEFFNFLPLNYALWDRFWAEPCVSFLPVSPLIMVRFFKFKNCSWMDLSELNGPQA